MKSQSQFVLTAFLLCAPALSASPFLERTVYPFPSIPQGQDWGIILLPDPAIPQLLLSLEEAMRILPSVPPLHYDFPVHNFVSAQRREKSSAAATAACLVVALILLLAGYDLIPRAQASALRLRSMHFEQDLLT